MKPVKNETPKNKTVKKPFGLGIASKLAIQAIHEGVAPTSVILGNLFTLQKSTVFPKNLDVQYFSVSKAQLNEQEVKITKFLMEEMKKPGVDKQQLLEQTFEQNWVFKKAPPQEVEQKTFKKPKVQRSKQLQPIVTPTIVVKKSRSV